jgi:hypothetical protein
VEDGERWADDGPRVRRRREETKGALGEHQGTAGGLPRDRRGPPAVGSPTRRESAMMGKRWGTLAPGTSARGASRVAPGERRMGEHRGGGRLGTLTVAALDRVGEKARVENFGSASLHY